MSEPIGTLATGLASEKLALEFLHQHGFELVTRNYRCKAGELDIIAFDKQVLVFVEVRYRKDERFGSAAETVTYAKQRKLIKAAQFFLMQNPNYGQCRMRFDVIGINGQHQIQWIKGAFLAS